MKLHVSDGSSVHHQELFTVHSAMVYVIQVCRQLSSRVRMFHPDPARKIHALISQIYFGMKIYMFWAVPLSIIRSYSLFTQQWYMSYSFVDSFRAGSGCSIPILLESCLQICMTYTIAECTVNNSWWWTEELSETCWLSFQNKFEKLARLVGFIIRK
jgi:hypothetical protein